MALEDAEGLPVASELLGVLKGARGIAGIEVDAGRRLWREVGLGCECEREDGLDVVRALISRAAEVTVTGAQMLVEIGAGQARAVEAIANGRTVEVDAGRINDRLFLNGVVFGVFSDLASERERLRESGLGQFASIFWRGLIRLLRSRTRMRMSEARTGRPSANISSGSSCSQPEMVRAMRWASLTSPCMTRR